MSNKLSACEIILFIPLQGSLKIIDGPPSVQLSTAFSTKRKYVDILVTSYFINVAKGKNHRQPKNAYVENLPKKTKKNTQFPTIQAISL